MPDMYRSSSYETYQANALFADSVSAMKPVAGTIPRGFDTDFPFPNTNEGYEAAGAQFGSSDVLPRSYGDARAEYEVFVRFSKLVAGRMAVIISHRFSTVRMADRIIVLQDGLVVEEGSHDELVERGGPYAELFTLQAEGYR